MSMRCRVGLIVCGLMLPLLAACVDKADRDVPEEAPERLEQGIINGQLDTTHRAVVALFGRGSLCSGTIVQTDPDRGIGWVLTAAHCVDDAPQFVIQADDINDRRATTYEVIDFEAHPAYSSRSSEFDFAVVRFAGAARSTPVIPVVTGSDGLGRGDNVTSVGYGRTTPSSQPSDNNSQRRTITRPLSRTSNTFLVYSLSTGGICQGDSGGAVLANVNGAERVVGVHSSVTGDCTGDGFSGRVSGVYDTWLRGALAGQIEDSCELCRQVAQSGDGACTPVIQNCLDTPDCADFVNCLNNCNNDACSQRCVETHRDGVDDYTAIFDCVCEDACAQQCEGDEFCPEPPACGLSFSDVTCNTCNEDACCAQTQACADDSTCQDCISGNASQAECSNNAAFNAFFGCIEDNCGDECGVDNECGFSTDESACGQCIENDCCAQGAACIDSDNCAACAQGEGQNCAEDEELLDLLTCLSLCEGNPCDIDLGDDPGDSPVDPGGDPNNDPGDGPGDPGDDPNNDPGDDFNNDPGDDSPGGFVGDPEEDDSGFVGNDGFFNNADAQPAPACSATPVNRPAPGGFALLLLGLVGVAMRARRR